MTLIVTVIVVALAFEYINGFHDTANSIATVVSTKVLTPRQAVMLAACTNLFGASWARPSPRPSPAAWWMPASFRSPRTSSSARCWEPSCGT
jgi:hypothetical protein